MTFFHTLQDRTAAERDHLLTAPVLQLAVDGKLELHTYIAFLTQAYHHVKHTVPLLMACGARLPERTSGCAARSPSTSRRNSATRSGSSTTSPPAAPTPRRCATASPRWRPS